MSLDFSLITTVFDGNVTHNLTNMANACGLYEVLWRPDEYDYNYARDIIERLELGLSDLKLRPGHFKKHNPANGWGDYEGFVAFVERLLEECKRYPDASITVSR